MKNTYHKGSVPSNCPDGGHPSAADGKIDFVILGRQMLADPNFVQKCMDGKADKIHRCLRCYKCFPGSPEEGYTDLPFNSEELSVYVGYCTINPMAHLPFDPEQLPPAEKGSRKRSVWKSQITASELKMKMAFRSLRQIRSFMHWV